MKALIPSKVAEIIYALIIAVFGVNHFMNTAALAGDVPDYMPGDEKIWVYVSGAGLILAAIAIITGIKKTLASYLLALLLLIFSLGHQLYWMLNTTDADHKYVFQGNLMKDAALAMCAILIANRSAKS